MKYHTNNLTPEQNDLVEAIRDLLETYNAGPYGGKGRSVSKGEAIAYACENVLKPLAAKVEQRVAQKRREAAARRQNNNPNITPGISRRAA